MGTDTLCDRLHLASLLRVIGNVYKLRLLIEMGHNEKYMFKWENKEIILSVHLSPSPMSLFL